MDLGSQPNQKSALRHYGFVMAFAVLGLVLMLYGYQAVTFVRHSRFVDHTIAPLFGVASSTVEHTATSTGLSRAVPVRIEIPSIKLNTTFVPPLGLGSDKTVSVPDSFTQVGWYSGGAAPGEIGPAVILGHVDSKAGPAVFYSLGQVKVGDTIRVTRTDGVIATFAITELHRYPQSDFPTLDVYGPTDYAALRLVTCSGVYDHGNQKYSHNLVVYARLVQ